MMTGKPGFRSNLMNQIGLTNNFKKKARGSKKESIESSVLSDNELRFVLNDTPIKPLVSACCSS